MIGLSAFTVLALGLRHGADPDHLAAIDNLTRNSLEVRPKLSRYVGALFAGGHSLMVLAIAGLVGLLGTRFSAQHALIETVGTIISIVVLVLIGVMNLRQLRDRQATRIRGAKMQLLPKILAESKHPAVAVIVGLLFGFGFETSSQVATYALAFGSESGWLGALAVGGLFCLGMIITDTLDSILVHRLIRTRGAQPQRAQAAVRLWIGTVTAMAFVVAAYESAQLCGWQAPFPDIALSGALVVTLFAIFAAMFVSTRSGAYAQGFDPHVPVIGDPL